MQPDQHYIYELMSGKLIGELSEEEEQCLEQLIANDPEVRKQWELFKSKFSTKDIETRLSHLDNTSWGNIGELITTEHTGKRKSKIFRLAGWAAALLAGISISVYFIARPVKREGSPVAAIIKKEKTIELTLANGATVNLSGAQDSIQLGGTLLNNRNKTLSYSVRSSQPAGSGGLNRLNTLTVPVGRDYHVVLSDGSEIWLNSATKLRFPFAFTNNKREIAISGEAYLKVAKDSRKPFIVHLLNDPASRSSGIEGPATIEVVGTAFNVNSYDHATVKVALVEGAVLFKTAVETTAIKPGIEAVYTENKGVITRKFNKDDVLSWREGKFYFTEATLEEITSVLPRWYGVDVIIDDADMAQERFTGVINRYEPITVFLDKMTQITQIGYYFDPEGTLHFKHR